MECGSYQRNKNSSPGLSSRNENRNLDIKTKILIGVAFSWGLLACYRKCRFYVVPNQCCCAHLQMLCSFWSFWGGPNDDIFPSLTNMSRCF